MKKLITILLIMSVMTSFTMSTGCFAEEKITPTEAFQNLLLTEDENTCGVACKTKNYMGNILETIKGIPGTIKVTIATIFTSAVFFRNIYKVYTNEILKLHNENAELFKKYSNLLREKSDLSSEKERFNREKEELSNQLRELLEEEKNKLSEEKRSFLKAVKAKFDDFMNSFSGSFLNNVTQRLDPLSLTLDRISEKVAAEKTHKEERKNQLLARTEELLKLQTLNAAAEEENQKLKDQLKKQKEDYEKQFKRVKEMYYLKIAEIESKIP